MSEINKRLEQLERSVEQARGYVETEERKVREALAWLDNARAILAERAAALAEEKARTL